jgi:hypothetical protein
MLRMSIEKPEGFSKRRRRPSILAYFSQIAIDKSRFLWYNGYVLSYFNHKYMGLLKRGAEMFAAGWLAASGVNAEAKDVQKPDVTHVEHVPGDNGTVLVDSDGLIVENKGPDTTSPDYNNSQTTVSEAKPAEFNVKPGQPSRKGSEAEAARLAQYQTDHAEVEADPGHPNPDKPANPAKVANQ